jgi:hypothetical protein
MRLLLVILVLPATAAGSEGVLVTCHVGRQSADGSRTAKPLDVKVRHGGRLAAESGPGLALKDDAAVLAVSEIFNLSGVALLSVRLLP